MTTVDRISQQVNQLPQSFQREVLDFIEFLIVKSRHKLDRDEDSEWSSMSLASAMRDMDDEAYPVYDEADLKEKWG
ncbi:MAG: DUF2281 domain-containing protein [Deferribacteres bacterium]|nr:DUF2281 domain-containing protein [Deferribacteres bacterium]